MTTKAYLKRLSVGTRKGPMGSKNNLNPGLTAGSRNSGAPSARFRLGCLEALASTQATQKGFFDDVGMPKTWAHLRKLRWPHLRWAASKSAVCCLVTNVKSEREELDEREVEMDERPVPLSSLSPLDSELCKNSELSSLVDSESVAFSLSPLLLSTLTFAPSVSV